MAERLRFDSMGISVEGEKHILEDLVDTIRRAEHEGIEAGNPVSDLIYSIEVGLELNGMGRDVEEEVSSPASRLDRLKVYKNNETVLKQAEEQKKMNEAEGLVGKIRALKPRIDELIATGNACLENGIELDAYHSQGWFNRADDCYERGTFVTNGISHKVGFVREWGVSDKGHHQFTMLGINNGGACGPYDFRTDGEKVYFVHENNKSDIKGPDYKVADLTAFIKRFGEFESAFYSYVDKLLEKQAQEVAQKLVSVGDIIENASKRAGGVVNNDNAREVELN